MVFLATSLSKPAVKQPGKHEVRVCEAASWKEKTKGRGAAFGFPGYITEQTGCETAGKARSAGLRSCFMERENQGTRSGIWKGGCETAGKARSAGLRSAHSLKQVKSEMLLMRNGRKNARK